jgi:hypothetical protein
MGDRQIPDVPASHYLVAEVVEDRDRGMKRAARWGLTAAQGVVFKEVPNPSESGDHRAVVEVSDRFALDVVYVQDRGHDPAGAVGAKQAIEEDLARKDIETFLAEYSIDWSPPGAGARDDGGN